VALTRSPICRRERGKGEGGGEGRKAGRKGPNRLLYSNRTEARRKLSPRERREDDRALTIARPQNARIAYYLLSNRPRT